MHEKTLYLNEATKIDLTGVPDGWLSHVDMGSILERIPADKCLEIMRGIAQKMEDGGTLHLCVTDFDWLCDSYRSGTSDVEKVLCGKGTTRSIWNRGKIADLVNMAGFEVTGGIGSIGWKPCAERIEVRCEKRNRKEPVVPMSDITAVMSLPRIAWTDTFAHTLEVCSQLQMRFVKSTGVFWGQCLERMLEREVEAGQKYALTIDYDSIFDARDVVRLWQIMEDRPDIAALCPLQIGRDRDQLLLNCVDADGKPMDAVTVDHFYNEAIEIKNGHFGLTLIRLSALKDVPHPWFLGVPGKDGRWGDDRTDDDIYFWHMLRSRGLKVCATPKVRLGHLQLVITWPMDDCSTRHQYLGRYHSDGRPPECQSY